MKGKIENLLYWMTETAKKNSQKIECENGSADFVTSIEVNQYSSRIKRAIEGDEYYKMLMSQVDCTWIDL